MFGRRTPALYSGQSVPHPTQVDQDVITRHVICALEMGGSDFLSESAGLMLYRASPNFRPCISVLVSLLVAGGASKNIQLLAAFSRHQQNEDIISHLASA